MDCNAKYENMLPEYLEQVYRDDSLNRPQDNTTKSDANTLRSKTHNLQSFDQNNSMPRISNSEQLNCTDSTLLDAEFVRESYTRFWAMKENLASERFYYKKKSKDMSTQFEGIEVLYLPKPRPIDAEFLELVCNGDVQTVEKFIQEHPEVDINCVNFQGITALHIFVQNRSEAMLEFLLQQRNIEIGDTVLYAVRDNHIKILVKLLDALKKVSPGLEFAGISHSTLYPGYVTPLILAAQHGHYEMVQMLISRGHTIIHPHKTACYCPKCKLSIAREDPLYVSSARLSVYRAISTPVYLVTVTSDPILVAFQLSAELKQNAKTFIQMQADYLALEDSVSAFAVDLIGLCRTSQEVELVLKQSHEGSRNQCVLPRLLMAAEYKQKGFVAHPNTQQVLESHWLGDWHQWKNMSFLSHVGIVLARIFITPLILLTCMIAPRHRLVKHWQIPLNKLITHAAAYLVFLALIFYISNQDRSKQKRGPPNTGVEGPVILYVIGYTWSALRMCVIQGPKRYFSEMWNWTEVLMLLLFGVTFVLWTFAAIDVAVNDMQTSERKFWSQYDMTLLAEGTFCLATIFAYFRLMLFCQLSYQLGPLQVSLGKMTYDIYKYIIVFTIIISAFAAGLARFYQYYDGMVYEDVFGMKTVQVSSFTSLTDTLNTLFWALFCMAPLESADVVLENTRGLPDSGYKDNRHAFTERVGYFCFGCFEVISVIVVLNMLIATMSNTFQRVTDNVAIEWRFGRTQVYVNYMSQTTLPSPYNMVPTAAGVSTMCEWLRNKYLVSARWSKQYCTCLECDLESELHKEYPALMSVLVQRYFRGKSVQADYALPTSRSKV